MIGQSKRGLSNDGASRGNYATGGLLNNLSYEGGNPNL